MDNNIVNYDCSNKECSFKGKIENHCNPPELIEAVAFNCPECHSPMKMRKSK